MFGRITNPMSAQSLRKLLFVVFFALMIGLTTLNSTSLTQVIQAATNQTITVYLPLVQRNTSGGGTIPLP